MHSPSSAIDAAVIGAPLATSRTRSQATLLVLTLGILNALTPFSIDLYLPAFPQIAADLNTAIPRVSLSIPIYFIGFALGQIFYGPLLDRFGRKPPLYFGLAVYVLASIGCMNARTVEALLVFRLLSALGGSAASVGAMTMVRDCFPARDGAKIFSMLMLVLSVSPMLAPSIGSLLVGFWSWRVIFAVLTALALIDFFLVAFALPNDYKPDASVQLSLRSILKTFGSILKNPDFRIYTFAGSLSFAGLFVYVAASPSIYMDAFHLSPKSYGAIFALLAGAMIGGGQLNHLLMRRWPSKTVFKAALAAQTATAFVFLSSVLVFQPGLIGVTAFLFILLLSTGITSPNASALALEPFSKNVGSASSLLGFLQMGTGALLSAAVGLLDTKGVLPTAAAIAGATALAIAILLAGRRK